MLLILILIDTRNNTLDNFQGINGLVDALIEYLVPIEGILLQVMYLLMKLWLSGEHLNKFVSSLRHLIHQIPRYLQ